MPARISALGRRPRRESSLLGAYAGTFRTRRRLARAEEAALARRAARGDRAALETLVQANFAFLVKTAMGFQGRGIPLEDLIGEACMGVLEAAPRFDASRGFRFMTYAVWWVRRALVRAVSTQSRNVRIPRSRATADRKADRPPLREISLSDGWGDDPDGQVEDALAADDPPLEDVVLRREHADMVHAALDALPERQRHVLVRRFGLDGAEAQTLLSIAGDLGVTKERVRQIEGQALRRVERVLSERHPGS